MKMGQQSAAHIASKLITYTVGNGGWETAWEVVSCSPLSPDCTQFIIRDPDAGTEFVVTVQKRGLQPALTATVVAPGASTDPKVCVPDPDARAETKSEFESPKINYDDLEQEPPF